MESCHKTRISSRFTKEQKEEEIAVTYCYNLIEEKACLLQAFFVSYSMVKKDKKMSDKCSKCGKIPAKIEYKNKNYCTWYCAKKDK